MDPISLARLAGQETGFMSISATTPVLSFGSPFLSYKYRLCANSPACHFSKMTSTSTIFSSVCLSSLLYLAIFFKYVQLFADLYCTQLNIFT